MTHKTHQGGTNTTKDVIYIDIDDEITAIIEKVHSSDKKIVALVLPKRATVLQSIVNMKLLKRAAGDAKKNLVLITAESSLMPLAGSVGMHVAKSLNSKPEVPDAPERMTERADAAEDVDVVEDVALDSNKSVGELSGRDPVDDDGDEESIELDDDDEKTLEVAESTKDGQKPKGKKFKIPDFNKFRVMLVLAGVGVIALGMVGYAAIAVWPKATVTIQTDSQSVTSSMTLTLKTAADTQLDAAKAIVPAQLQEVKKTLTQEAPATGHKNNGDKASGSITIQAEACAPSLGTPDAVPSGSGVSANGLTFITQQKATFSFDHFSSGSCATYKTAAVSIAAQSSGAKYNVTGATFTVSGRSGVSATGSASGGTDEIVKVISQSDVDGAKQKITEQNAQSIGQELKSALIGRDLFPIEPTLTIGDPETSLSAEVNTEADTVTVTQTVTYTMLGAKEEDLEKVIAADVKEKIDTKKQSIRSYGLDDAYFSLQGVNTDEASVSIQTTAIAGAELNVGSIKSQVAGKKASEAKELISANPGVTNVVVEYSPFWVGAIPKKTDKITVVIQEPKVTADDTNKSP